MIRDERNYHLSHVWDKFLTDVRSWEISPDEGLISEAKIVLKKCVLFGHENNYCNRVRTDPGKSWKVLELKC